MFRVLDNVPEIYIKESRDFQLISRLYDVLFSGVKYDIDSMVNLLDATLVKDSMLQLMCNKVGFFTSVEIDNHVLKYIIASFPYIIRNKGSVQGIKCAVNAIIRSESYGHQIPPSIEVITLPTNSGQQGRDSLGKDANEEYVINIYTGKELLNKLALLELMRYVLPVGMFYTINIYKKGFNSDEYPTQIAQGDAINIMQVKNKLAGTIKSTLLNNELEDMSILQSDIMKMDFAKRLIGAYDTTVVVNSDDLYEKDEHGKIKIDALTGEPFVETSDVKQIFVGAQQAGVNDGSTTLVVKKNGSVFLPVYVSELDTIDDRFTSSLLVVRPTDKGGESLSGYVSVTVGGGVLSGKYSVVDNTTGVTYNVIVTD